MEQLLLCTSLQLASLPECNCIQLFQPSWAYRLTSPRTRLLVPRQPPYQQLRQAL